MLVGDQDCIVRLESYGGNTQRIFGVPGLGNVSTEYKKLLRFRNEFDGYLDIDDLSILA